MSLVMAKLTPVDKNGSPAGEAVTAHFNPKTLRLSHRAVGPNTAARSSSGGAASGAMSSASSQRTGYTVSLSSIELLFDTTTDGEDVRNTTLKITKMIHLPGTNSAPTVQFQWGTFLFRGTIDSVEETLEYFSESGVPLRATCTIAMTMNEVESAKNAFGLAAGASAGLGVSAGFSAGVGISAGVGFSASASVSAGIGVGTTPLTLAPSGESLQNLAARAGVDWKTAASANGIDNPRAVPPGTALNLNAGVSVKGSIK